MTTARQLFIDQIIPALPDDWDVVPYMDTLDELSANTVVLNVTDVEKAPSAPRGNYLVSAEVALYVPQGTNLPATEDALDAALEVLLPALDSMRSQWSKATKNSAKSVAMFYLVTVQFLADLTPDSHETPDPDPEEETP